MSTRRRTPILVRLYQHYLLDEDAARFIAAVSEHYVTGSLERLALGGAPMVRRAAVLALGWIGPYDCSPVLARALHDSDRGVRILADNGIRQVWVRAGGGEHQRRLRIVMRKNLSGEHAEAAEEAGRLIAEAPGYAEAWSQRAAAHYFLQQYERAADDCQQTLELNPHHFLAAVRMAHCYLHLDDVFAALDYFRRALRLNPNLDGVRAQLEHLQRTLEGR